MSQGAETSWSAVWNGFETLWADLSAPERDAFWKSAGKYVHGLGNGSRERLCLALHDIESGKSVGPSRGLIPVKVRQRSAEELQRAVGRHKAQLLVTERAQHFLVNAACDWIQFSYTAALNDMLDAVGCARDETGKRKGAIPAFSPDAARLEALRLAQLHGTRQLMLVCAGLMLSDLGWDGLSLARKGLEEAQMAMPASSQSSTTEELVAAEGSSASDPGPLFEPARDAANMSGPSVDETTLGALAADLENLASFLSSAAAVASSGEIPDLTSVLDLWESLQARHATVAAQLNVNSARLPELAAALAARGQHARDLAQLSRCRAIRHADEPDFALIRDRCGELETTLKQGPQSSVVAIAIRSLLRLVDEGKHLDDNLAGDLQAEVEPIFGRKVALAAVRGKLIAGAADADDSGRNESAIASGESTTELPTEFAPLPPDPPLNVEPEAGEKIDKVAVTADTPPAPETTAESASTPSEFDATTARALLNAAVQATEAPPAITAIDADDVQKNVVEGLLKQDVAEDFESFDEFCRTHWVDASGKVAVAPWSAPGFAQAISANALKNWRLGEAGIAYLQARAAQAAGAVAPLQLDDLAQADELLSTPDSPTAGRWPERVERLRRSINSNNDVLDPSIGVGLMLEALRPTLPCTLTPSEIESLLKLASYHDSGLDEIVAFLLAGWTSQIDPLASLRRRLLEARQEPFEKLEDNLRKAQDALKREITALWSAAGGKIQRTHCRAAWTRFVQEQVAPLRDELAPNGAKGLTAPKLIASSIGSRVVGMGRAFVRIMDSANVKHQDRSAADNAAQQIVAAISQVADALLAVETRQQQDRTSASYDGVPFDAGMRLMANAASSTTDRLCASMFAAVLKQRPAPNGLRIQARHLLSHIDTIRFLDPAALTRPGIARDGLRVLDVDEARAVGVLLQDDLASDVEAPSVDEEFLWALRDAAAEGARRDVLAALSQTSVLLDHQRTLLHQYAFDLAAETFQQSHRLETVWGACDELMAPCEAKLKLIIDEARDMAQPGLDAGISVSRRLLRLTWLTRNVELAVAQRDSVVDTLLTQARTEAPHLAERAASFFQAEDYRAGFALLHGGGVPEVDSNRLGGRRTIWRDDALNMWPEPRTKLSQDLRGPTEDQQRLVDTWSSSVGDAALRDTLPKLLYALVSGETDRARSEKRPVRLGDLREHQARKTIINCEAIRSYFQKTGMNPTFLPQLADYRQIVLMPLPQSGSRGGNVPSDWAAAAVSDDATSSLYAFLAPGISLTRRDDLCADLRKRGITAAVVDDVDMCRLCAAFAGDHPQSFVPFLEILLEQIDLGRASPFSSLDGQHVRLETYVGRDQEARKIALSAEYTRLFSGRKLGKSALLKYVVDRFDGGKLDSDNTLNVFFITIAGGDSEQWVVDAILAAMIERFGLHERPEARGLDAAARFMDYMNHFLSEQPTHSVLLILDESDAFVEQQLARYNAAHDNNDREGSLSFRMMKQLPAQDAKGLPRIRTLFSGYRTTNTRGGVWANAGDVLLLQPLEDYEAVKFLQGMLARIGISLGSHAPFVAMRCGFQPAVLIRFGESLVKRLRRSTRSAHREKLVVSREEVSATLADQAVLDEIKTVVNNNFQGNRMGAVVFGATLLALKDLEPGFALTDGAAQVLAKLSEIDPDLDWLARFDASPLAEIERHLQDFIERGLLMQAESHRRFGDREYRLRFPHFLTVLTRQSDVAQEVRQQIQAIRGGGTQRRLAECVLSESALSTTRYWYRERDSATCKLVVVGGHWARALMDTKCGVPDRLGCDKHSIVDLAFENSSTAWHSGVRVLCNASDKHWPWLLEVPAARPLVVIGGLDLQRTAMKHDLEGGAIPVEVVTLGRLTHATLAWWFEDARALHFSSSDAIARIAQATDLVPYLVDALDQLLPQAPGTDVSAASLHAALEALEASIPTLAKQLCDTSRPGHLAPREAKLLAMAGQVADQLTDDFHLEREFQECWTMLNPDESSDAPLSDSGDWQSLKLLVGSGLLPARVGPNDDSGGRSLGRVRFERGGPLMLLTKALRSHRAA